MRSSLLIVTILVLLSALAAHAVPMRVPECNTVPARELTLAQDVCYLGYFNFCSGWVYYWSSYCYGMFDDRPYYPKYGTCFDLTDCPGGCRHLTDLWWACKRFTTRGWVYLEVFCADEHGCPVEPPLAGIYGYNPNFSTAWQHFNFGGLPLCPCEDYGPGKFIFMVTDVSIFGPYAPHIAPYSDINSLNINAGCEAEWKCEGHSYVFQNVVDYCTVYGRPGPMWISGPNYGCTNYPTVPPGCHNYFYAAGFFSEWLIDCYLSCQGATETEKASWSEIKGLYR